MRGLVTPADMLGGANQNNRLALESILPGALVLGGRWFDPGHLLNGVAIALLLNAFIAVTVFAEIERLHHFVATQASLVVTTRCPVEVVLGYPGR